MSSLPWLGEKATARHGRGLALPPGSQFLERARRWPHGLDDQPPTTTPQKIATPLPSGATPSFVARDLADQARDRKANPANGRKAGPRATWLVCAGGRKNNLGEVQAHVPGCLLPFQTAQARVPSLALCDSGWGVARERGGGFAVPKGSATCPLPKLPTQAGEVSLFRKELCPKPTPKSQHGHLAMSTRWMSRGKPTMLATKTTQRQPAKNSCARGLTLPPRLFSRPPAHTNGGLFPVFGLFIISLIG